jgi:hypothetical protein
MPVEERGLSSRLILNVEKYRRLGYGDMFPITIGGKIFTFFVLMIGLGTVAVPTGLIASALSQARNEDRE